MLHETDRQREQLTGHARTRDAAAVRRDDAGQRAQKCTFPSAVAADHAEALSAIECEAHVLQRPEFRTAHAQLRVEGDADVLQRDECLAHVTPAISRSAV
jgi:hypothetical protein